MRYVSKQYIQHFKEQIRICIVEVNLVLAECGPDPPLSIYGVRGIKQGRSAGPDY